MRRVLVLIALVALTACSSEPTARDLPPDVMSARPSITAEEAKFVLAVQDLGVTVTGQSVGDDIEIGTTTCWALKTGGLTLDEIARDSQGAPLPNSGDGLRTKKLMYAAVQALCPTYDSQLHQLKLPS
ncbi:MAG: DUF732 domain-containing protein [Intrasporangium sp.]|uniref:DUF732 domain-containing protein n=1 Tax=Intrasporangium sp. TaxID=1925024 RepID=UPI002648B2FF|nr:DUF732 domain-containing protein [Intrasporangium sp.]MDN5795153.1 DUF732 domain-containing protein [Intrasporangium sp.]